MTKCKGKDLRLQFTGTVLAITLSALHRRRTITFTWTVLLLVVLTILLIYSLNMTNRSLRSSSIRKQTTVSVIESSNNPLDSVGSYITWCETHSEHANKSPHLNCAKTDNVIPVTKDFNIFSTLLHKAMDS
jgi:hypothetical protein